MSSALILDGRSSPIRLTPARGIPLARMHTRTHTLTRGER